MYNTELLNDIEKEIVEIDKKIGNMLDGTNPISLSKLEEIEELPYVSIEDNGMSGNNPNLHWYSLYISHEDCELDIESYNVYVDMNL